MGSVSHKHHLIEGDGDQVKRKERFCERHPSVDIWFDRSITMQRATYQDPATGELVTTVGYAYLKHLLDFLEGLFDSL